MRITLATDWNGEPLPPGAEGSVDVHRKPPGELVFAWDLALALPSSLPVQPAGFHDGLWEYDVVELFLSAGARDGAVRYIELEVGPGGHWLALGFRGVRTRTEHFTSAVPELEQSQSTGRWIGRASFPLAELESFLGPPPFHGLAAACLGAGSERRTLCAPALPGRQPDFHQPRAWPLLVKS